MTAGPSSADDLAAIARQSAILAQLGRAHDESQRAAFDEMLDQERNVLSKTIGLEQKVEAADAKRRLMEEELQDASEQVEDHCLELIETALAQLKSLAHENLERERAILFTRACTRELVLEHGINISDPDAPLSRFIMAPECCKLEPHPTAPSSSS